MTWLVFALSVLLALAGVVSVVSGAPIIQIERGWAEVIAGTVAVSGGLVAFALGVVLLRLQDLVEAAQRTERPMPTDAPAVVPEPALALALEADEPDLYSTRAPDEALFVAPAETIVVVPNAIEERLDPVPALSGVKTSRWRLRGDRAETPAEDEPLTVIVPHPPADEAPLEQPSAPDEPVHAVEPVHAEAIVPHTRPSMTPDPEIESPTPRQLPTPMSDLPGVGTDEPPRASSFFRDWRSRPLRRSRELPVSTPEVPPPMFEAPPPEDNEAPPVDIRAAEPDPSQAPLIDVKLAAEDPATSPEPAVIGRYQAGASSYTMYADGAIDVETEGGDRHRFASMDELKAFIARQEQAVT